jgi:hypothetical protein
MERVHSDCVARCLDGGGAARRLEHAELRLELCRMAAESVESLANALGIETVPACGDVLETRQARQRRGSCPVWAFGCHAVVPPSIYA